LRGANANQFSERRTKQTNKKNKKAAVICASQFALATDSDSRDPRWILTLLMIQQLDCHRKMISH